MSAVTWRRSVRPLKGASRPRLSREGFTSSTACVAAVAVAAPFWDLVLFTLPVGILTLGRALVGLSAVLFLLDIRGARHSEGLALTRAGRRVAGAYILFGVWAAASAALWGCECQASLAAYGELALTGVIALALLSRSPASAPVLLAGCLLGGVVAASVALAGVGPIGAGSSAGTVGRLSGTFGNANHLGYALALVMPIGLVALKASRLGGWMTVGVSGALVLMVATLALTFSRGAGIALVTSYLVVLLLMAESRRSRVLVGLGTALAATSAAIAYPLFLDARVATSFAQDESSLPQPDRSGWDPASEGLPARPSSLSNRVDALRVKATRPGEGVSHTLDESRRGRVYSVTFEARAETGSVPFAFGIKTAKPAGPEAVANTAVLDREWRQLTVTWGPPARDARAQVYFWQGAESAAFLLRKLEVVETVGFSRPRTLAISTELLGSPGRRQTEGELAEGKYLDSRLEGAQLALDAFREQPLRGIGWDTFPRYADEKSDFGDLATHNEYLRVAAELGAVGALIALFGLSALIEPIRLVRRWRPASVAATGVLVAGLVSQFFVNGIFFYDASVPLVVGAAVIAAGSRTSSAASGPLLPHEALDPH